MYKSRKTFRIVILLMIIFSFIGCNQKRPNSVSKDQLHILLSTLKTYETNVMITFLKNTPNHIIKMTHQVEIGGTYQLVTQEPAYLKGYTISFDGKIMTEYDPNRKTTVTSEASQIKNQILLSSFIHNYLLAEEITRAQETLNGKQTTTIEVAIPGQYKYLAKQKVWFDNKNAKPIQMQIYDIENNVTIHIEFSDFKSNT